MSAYLQEIDKVATLLEGQPGWRAISPEYTVRMRKQNRFQTGLEIAQ